MRYFILAALLLWTTGCAETQFIAQAGKMLGREGASSSGVPYKVGKPYQIDGRWYRPQEDWTYSETGTASWYGDQFHGRPTANGEIFDKNSMTAAHRTLPLPSLIRVTNLENGRTANLRVNDRGPFAHGRILDVSHEAARVLGFESQGVAKVKVELLTQESMDLATSLGRSRDGFSSMQPQQQMAANQSLPFSNQNGVIGEGRGFAAVETQILEQPHAAVTSPDPIVPPQSSPETSSFIAAQAAPMPNSAPQNAFVTPPDYSHAASAPATSVPPSVPASGRGLFIQAGAFSQADNAERLSAKLKSLANTQIAPVQSGGRTLYRVRIGPLSNHNEAFVLQEKMAALGVFDSKIIQD